MGDAFVSFEPHFLPNQTLPPLYGVEGITDEKGSFYYWWRADREPAEFHLPVDFGPYEPDRYAARRGAWADYRAREQTHRKVSP